MGACFSQPRGVSPLPLETAKVISVNGELHEYNVPITVLQVLQAETYTSSASPTAFSSFVCDSDHLRYEELIPALRPDEELVPNQVYFVLPSSRLQHRLTAPDMAALAVKASLALQNVAEIGGRRRGSKTQIFPVLGVESFARRGGRGGVGVSEGDVDVLVCRADEFTIKKSLSIKSTTTTAHRASTVSRSEPGRKLQRSLPSLKRKKHAVPLSKIRLTTINEGFAM